MRFRCHHPIPGSKRFFRTGNSRVAVLMGSRKPAGPGLDLNFLQGPLFSRASVGSYFDSLGNLQSAAINVPRYNFTANPPGVINWIRNSSMVGAVAGSPGTVPTNWTSVAATFAASGLTFTINSLSTINNVPTLNVTVAGTTTSSGNASWTIDGASTASNMQFTGSMWLQLTGGSATNFTGFATRNRSLPSGASNQIDLRFLLSSTNQQFTNTYTVGATDTSWQWMLQFNWNSGAAINISFNISAPQYETGSVAHAWVPTSTVAVNGTGVGTLMSEAASTNLALQSAALATTPWSANSITVSAPTVTNAVVTAPDGSLTGSRIVLPAVPSSGNASIVFQGAALSAGSYTFSVWLRGNVGGEQLYLQASLQAGGSYSRQLATLTTTWQRFTLTFTATSAPWYFTLGNDFRDTGAAATLAQTIFAWGAQLELGAVATSYIPTTTVAATRAAEAGVPLDPRIAFTRASGAGYFDATGTYQTAASGFPRIDFGPNPGVGAKPLGLLIEEARTNGIRNPRCEGSTPGTPGTPPANWVTQTVVGSGTENGLPYVDITYAGTTTSTFFTLYFEATTQIAAAQAQVWAISSYIRLVGGSLANVASQQFLLQEYTSGGSFLVSTAGATFSFDSSALAGQRKALALTVSQATTAFIRPGISFSCANGAAINITLRVGAPQLELGAFATSLILPVAGTPAASSRVADTATMPFVPSFPSSIVAEASLPSPVGTLGLVQIDDGGNNNRIELRATIALANVVYRVGGSVTVSFNTSGPVAANVPFKLGAALLSNGSNGCLSGGSVTNVSGAAPTSLTTMRLGQDGIGLGFTNGYLRRTRYWPRALSTQELQANTR
jgi:hypothetical protein